MIKFWRNIVNIKGSHAEKIKKKNMKYNANKEGMKKIRKEEKNAVFHYGIQFKKQIP